MDANAIDVLNAALEYSRSEPKPSLLLSDHDVTKQLLNDTRSVETASYFSSWLLNPDYQPNCVRLEALVHLCLATEDGDKTLLPKQLCECFSDTAL